VQWRGQAQALGAAWHGLVIDRLDIEAVAVQELVVGGFAQRGVADHDRYDVALRRHDRQACFGEAALEGCRELLMAVAFALADLQMADAGDGASAGGSELVKMNPGGWLRRKSISAAEPAT